MTELLKYFSSHPIVGVAFVLLIALTVFVWIKAVQSGNKRSAERDKIIAGIENEKKLRNDYREINEEVIKNETDKFRLIQGVCANIQMSIEKLPDINAEFLKLNDAKRYIYCIGYLLEDSKLKLSEFFRSNGEPLLSHSYKAVNEVIGGDFAKIFNTEYSMFDENNEDVSVSNELIEKTDSEYSDYINKNINDICDVCINYIKENLSDLI